MFYLGDFAIDRIISGVAEKVDGSALLYALSQLADATIDITAESKEVRDKENNLVYKRYTGKSGTLSANNVMQNANILAAQAGAVIDRASAGSAIEMPKIITVKAGETVTITDAVEGTIKVNAWYTSGNMGEAFTVGTSASATQFAYDADTGALTLPTVGEDAGYNQFVIKYNRNVTDGMKLKNVADKYPDMVRLTFKALYIDPCDSVLKACYIVIPKFQVSPETSLALQTDAQLAYNGDLIADYCAEDKTLYEFYAAADEDEDDE